MASQGARPRSSTLGPANSRRSKSRASTASIHSASTQPAIYHGHMPEAMDSFQPHYAHNQPDHLSPEEMISRSERQLTNPHQNFAIDPLLQDHNNHERALSVDCGFSGVQVATRSVAHQFQSYDGTENQPLESFNKEQPQGNAGKGRKKKGSAASVANDLELKRLFRENQGRSLKEVAAQVLANERTPRSEKTKQIFAMLW